MPCGLVSSWEGEGDPDKGAAPVNCQGAAESSGDRAAEARGLLALRRTIVAGQALSPVMMMPQPLPHQQQAAGVAPAAPLGLASLMT